MTPETAREHLIMHVSRTLLDFIQHRELAKMNLHGALELIYHTPCGIADDDNQYVEFVKFLENSDTQQSHMEDRSEKRRRIQTLILDELLLEARKHDAWRNAYDGLRAEWRGSTSRRDWLIETLHEALKDEGIELGSASLARVADAILGRKRL